jgi:hypothetical protein
VATWTGGAGSQDEPPPPPDPAAVLDSESSVEVVMPYDCVLQIRKHKLGAGCMLLAVGCIFTKIIFALSGKISQDMYSAKASER